MSSNKIKNSEGKEIFKFMKENFNLNRSITGKDTKKFLINIKKKNKLLKIIEFNSGKKVFDWTIPPEWNVKEAYIAKKNGTKIIDFKKNNLHIVGYSQKINKTLEFNKLKKNLHFIKDMPNAVPYITSYYKKNWGFCISYNQFKKMNEKEYDIKIDSTFNFNGKMNLGEIYIKGKSNKEIIISCNICHPSLMSNELSGPAIASELAQKISNKKNFYSYRFVFIPETIGAIAYLSKKLKLLKKNFLVGYHLTCLGIGKEFSVIKSRNENSYSSKISQLTIKQYKNNKIYNYLDRGSDERQYNSPGIDLSVCTLMRSKFFSFKEYHNSEDNLSKTNPSYLQESFNFVERILNTIENDFFIFSKVKGEPFLSKRGLYRSLNKNEKLNTFDLDVINVLAYADGKKISEICSIINRNFEEIFKICVLLNKHKLILMKR